MFQSWGHDVRFSLRRLRRRPAYTTLTVLTLALGVAGTAAVYGIARRILLQPLPYRAEGEVAVFWNQRDWSEAEFHLVHPELRAFRGVAAYRTADVTLQQDGAPARLIPGISSSAELFSVLGASPALGRGFRPGDDRGGAEPTAVLSHALWRDLGADPAIVGKRIELSGTPRTITGVMPRGFWFPDPGVGVWLSEELDPENQSGNHTLIARIPPGARIDGMKGALDAITRRLRETFTYPAEYDKTRTPGLTPVREYLVGSVRPSVVAMLAAMAVILLIACVNVAALMLGQVDSRGTELAVRAALGAERRQLLRQLVLEAVVIGALAGAVGAGLALVGFRYLVGALPLGELAGATTVDWALFTAAIGIALVASTAVAVAPAVSVARGNLQSRLTRTRTGGIGGRGGRLEGGMVVAQVALVLLMAAGAALLIRSVGKLRAIDPGVETLGIAVLDAVLPSGDPARRPQMVREMADAVAVLPGVASAGVVQKLPLRGRSGDNWGIGIERDPEREPSTTAFRMVTPGYFGTLGVRIRSGRGLLDTDRTATTEGTVVINQALAEKYFPGIDPVGQRIGFMAGRWDRIVGVVENVAEAELRDDPVPTRYMLYDQVPAGGIRTGHTLVMRMKRGQDPTAVLDAARRAIQAAVPGVAVREVTTMERVFTESLGPTRQVMSLLALLGSLALVLGTIGVYGVVSHFVARRRRDWAIRVALGLEPARVVLKIVGQGARLVGAGIVLGLAGFFALAHLLASFLYGVGTADPVAVAGATALLLAAGVLAALLPAWRAGRIDPARVLREQ